MDQKTLEYEASLSILEHYGTYVTNEKFITNPAIGREEEIKKLILVLLTPEKSAILIGKPGIGKTAIVEGLAFRLQQNDVPDALRGYQIVNMKTASLLGTMPSGESKVQKMIDELKTKDKIILFIDEIHMLIGSTETSSVDFANIFKEGLGRGSIKVIGATTTEEYERYILRDKAFTRRFQKIEILEPSEEEVVKIMMGTLPKFENQTGRKMKYTPFIKSRIMSFIVSITSEYKRVYALGSRYPDVSLTLLKQAFSYTVYDNREYVDIFDVRKAIENSKNIYPDVIRKELVNFDKDFRDLMLEEKGELEVAEWRKEDLAIQQEKIKEEAPPLIVNPPEPEKKEIKKAKVGKLDVSYGLKEKLNSYNNSKAIDELLFSSDVETIGENEVEIPTEFFVTEEIQEGGADNLLFGSVKDVNYRGPVNEEEYVYRVTKPKGVYKRVEEESVNKMERMDINDINFEKYHNFFGNSGGYDEASGRNPVDDFVSQDNNQYQDYNDQYSQGYEYGNQGYDYADPNYGYDDQGYDYGNQGYNYNNQNGYDNQGYAADNYDYGNNAYNQGYNYQAEPQSSFMNPNPVVNQQPAGESLFGAPMSGSQVNTAPQPVFDQLVTNSMRIKSGKIVDEFPTFEKLSNLSNIATTVIGDVNSSGKQEQSMFIESPSQEQSQFPQNQNFMYGEQQPGFMPQPQFGQMPNNPPNFMNGMPQNMAPQQGFAPPLGNMNQGFMPNQPVVNHPPLMGQQPGFMQQPPNMNQHPSFVSPAPQQVPNIPNLPDLPGSSSSSEFSPAPNSNSFFGAPMTGNSEDVPADDKKWKFIPEEPQVQPQQQMPSFIPTPAAPQQQNNFISSLAAPQQPASVEGQFLDFGQLNKGNIKQEESNKYIGVVKEEPKPTVDLNLEGNSKEDKEFDDFFE